MKLRPLWISASALLMCFAFSSPSLAVPTQCSIHKGSEWRCAKDNYVSDTIRIGNESTRHVNFKVSVWTSTCGKKGAEVSTAFGSVEPRSFAVFPLMEARANQCVEMFIYDCSTDACTNVLSAHPL
jgi:hypothetical protein